MRRHRPTRFAGLGGTVLAAGLSMVMVIAASAIGLTMAYDGAATSEHAANASPTDGGTSPGIVVSTSGGRTRPVDPPPVAAPRESPTPSWWERVAAERAAWTAAVGAPVLAARSLGTGASQSTATPVRPRGEAPPPVDARATIAAVRGSLGSVAPSGDSVTTAIRATRTAPASSRTTPSPRAQATASEAAAQSLAAGRSLSRAADTAPTRRPTRQTEWTFPTPTPGATRTVRPVTTAIATANATRAPIVRNGRNAWGVGIYRDSGHLVNVVRQTKPGVILLMDPAPSFARAVREAAPDAFIVGRRYRREDDQPLDRPRERGEEMADYVAELAVPLKGIVDAWMSYNEVLGSQPSADYAAYDAFQVAFARRLQNVYGVSAVAANDGSGALEPEDYPRHFAASIRESHFFGVHAYSPPGTASMRIDADWNALRYRRIHAALERAGITNVRMVITESGLGDGFRPGLIDDDAMSREFAWFSQELAKDPYMIGHAAFGLFDARGDWPRFELTDTTVPMLTRAQLDGRPA